MQQFIIEPPLYFAKDHIFDISFHPFQDLIATAEITGLVSILKYTSDDVVPLATFQHHKQSARVCRFFPDGQHLLSASKDFSFAVLDQQGKLAIHKTDAHKAPIYTALPIDNNLIVTADDNGSTKIWDLRTLNCVYKVKEVEEAVSAVVIDDSRNFMLTSSLDGYLSVFDLRVQSNNEKSLYARSDCMEEDLTDLCLVKGGRFVCASTSEGNLLLFKWDFFGDFKDRIVGHPNSINTMRKIDEHSILTGAEDGLLRGVGVFPNGITGVLGQHEEDANFEIAKIDVNHSQQIAASISHDSSIKFYDVSGFVKTRKNASVQNDEAEFVYSQVPKKKEQMEVDEEDSEGEDDDDDDDDDDSEEEEEDNKRKKRRSQKTRNIQQSMQDLKRQKRQKFFDKM